MATPPLAVKITHSGFYQDGRPNVSSILITDIDSGLDEPQTRQYHRSAVYVPAGGSITIPLSSRVLYSYVSGQISKLPAAGLASIELITLTPLVYQHYFLPASVPVIGASLLAGVETVLASTTLTAVNLLAQRRFTASGAVATSFNGADTWTFRVRVGGAGGEIVFDSGALVAADGGQHTFEVNGQIMTVGLAGTFNSSAMGLHSGALPPTVGFNTAGAINTTADVPVVFTVITSVADPAPQVLTLTDFVVDVLAP